MLLIPTDVQLPVANRDVRASIASSAMRPSTSLLGAQMRIALVVALFFLSIITSDSAEVSLLVERLQHPVNGQYVIVGASAIIDKGWPLEIFKIRDGTDQHAPGQDPVLAISVTPIPGHVPYCMNGKVVTVDADTYDLYLTWASVDTFTTAFKSAQMVFRIHGEPPYLGRLLQTLNYSNTSEEHQDQLKRSVQLLRWTDPSIKR